MTKRIVVVGGGNVGTFLATEIISSYSDCILTILESGQKRLEQIQKFGVNYKAGSGVGEIDIRIDPSKFSVVSSLESAQDPDFVFIATKSYQLTPEFYQEKIEPFLGENSKVILVQNGYPNSKILEVIGKRAVIMVVNAGFSLDLEGKTTITNKTLIDLPYGSLLPTTDDQDLVEIASFFSRATSRYDRNIIEDIFKKTQYACIGAYCAVEAFKNRRPRDQKFTFGDLNPNQKDHLGQFTQGLTQERSSQTERFISDIVSEVAMIAGFGLITPEDLLERRKINSKLENSLVTDARNGQPMERGIVDNLLILAAEKNLETPALSKLSKALEIIESDGWRLKPENIAAVQKLYPDITRSLL